MSIGDAQRRVDAWVGQFEEGYFHPLTNIARLTEEVGELAREVNHRFGQKTKKPGEPDGDLAMEMADIIFVLIERVTTPWRRRERRPTRIDPQAAAVPATAGATTGG